MFVEPVSRREVEEREERGLGGGAGDEMGGAGEEKGDSGWWRVGALWTNMDFYYLSISTLGVKMLES